MKNLKRNDMAKIMGGFMIEPVDLDGGYCYRKGNKISCTKDSDCEDGKTDCSFCDETEKVCFRGE